jgi:hypothetical protein
MYQKAAWPVCSKISRFPIQSYRVSEVSSQWPCPHRYAKRCGRVRAIRLRLLSQ